MIGAIAVLVLLVVVGYLLVTDRRRQRRIRELEARIAALTTQTTTASLSDTIYSEVIEKTITAWARE